MADPVVAGRKQRVARQRLDERARRVLPESMGIRAWNRGSDSRAVRPEASDRRQSLPQVRRRNGRARARPSRASARCHRTFGAETLSPWCHLRGAARRNDALAGRYRHCDQRNNRRGIQLDHTRLAFLLACRRDGNSCTVAAESSTPGRGSGLIRVAIDAEHTRQTSAGTARASSALIEALRKRDDVTPIVLGGGPLLRRGPLRKRLTTARQDFLWYPYLGRRRAAAAGAQVYHCPTPRAPLSRGKPPLVVTVYDLVSVLFPETTTPWSRLYGSVTLKRVLGAADLVMVSSNDTANDLTRLMKVSADRIRLVRIGVNEIFFAPSSTDASIAGPYVLFVGTPEPRKNIPRLVEAMELLRSRGFPHRLVIAGGNGWGHVEISSPNVEMTGRVSDSRLVSLYA